MLVITRYQMRHADADRLNQLTNLKVTLLFTYSGIDNPQIEPYPSHVAARSLMLMSSWHPAATARSCTGGRSYPA